MRFYITSIVSFCISVIALAVATSHHSQAKDQATGIEANPEVHVIRVLIDGSEVARFDAAGLHVQGDITYVGMIKDIGAEGYSAPGRDDANAR